MRQTVSKNFRDKIIKVYPACATEISYMRFIQYRLFSNNWEDKSKNLIKIPRYALAYCEGKLKQLAGKNYKGHLFLQEFKRDVQYIDWSDWSYEKGECRVAEFPIDKNIEWLLTLDVHKDYQNEGERFYLISGLKFTTKNRNAELKAAREKLQDELDEVRQSRNIKQVAAKIWTHLYTNSRDKHLLKVIDANIDVVEAAIDNRIDLIETKKKAYLELVDVIREGTIPMLHGVKNSCRLYESGASITGLPRQYRKMLCKGWTEFDIKSSQLAIVSSMWNISSIHQFLTNKNNVWDLFFNEFPVSEDEYDETKRFFKESLYSIVFGKKEANIAKEYDVWFGEGAGLKFSNIWLVRDLFDAREAEITRLANKPGGRHYSPAAAVMPTSNSYFKTGMSLGEQKKYKQTGIMPHSQRKRITSVMAQEVQMIEMAILNPVIDLAAKNSKNYVITLWQHDGFSVKFLDTSKRDKYTKVIKNGFQANLNRMKGTLNIPTYLEHEHLV